MTYDSVGNPIAPGDMVRASPGAAFLQPLGAGTVLDMPPPQPTSHSCVVVCFDSGAVAQISGNALVVFAPELEETISFSDLMMSLDS